MKAVYTDSRARYLTAWVMAVNFDGSHIEAELRTPQGEDLYCNFPRTEFRVLRDKMETARCSNWADEPASMIRLPSDNVGFFSLSLGW